MEHLGSSKIQAEREVKIKTFLKPSFIESFVLTRCQIKFKKEKKSIATSIDPKSIKGALLYVQGKKKKREKKYEESNLAGNVKQH